MCKQAKSLSRETFWVKTAPFSSKAEHDFGIIIHQNLIDHAVNSRKCPQPNALKKPLGHILLIGSKIFGGTIVNSKKDEITFD